MFLLFTQVIPRSALDQEPSLARPAEVTSQLRRSGALDFQQEGTLSRLQSVRWVSIHITHIIEIPCSISFL